MRISPDCTRVLLATDPSEMVPAPTGSAALSVWEASRRYFPSLLRAAAITLVLSCAAMVLAVVLGALIASGRVYGPRPLQAALTAYVEVMRGTPLLLQLFVLYFGLASFVQLPAFLAALIGLGLNYAAYESEIHRGRSKRSRRDSSTPPALWGSAIRRRSCSCADRRRFASRSPR